MPRSRNQGRNSRHPTSHPAALKTNPVRPPDIAQNTKAAAEAPNVRTFGIRRDRKSVTHAARPTTSTATCETLSPIGIYGGSGDAQSVFTFVLYSV